MKIKVLVFPCGSQAAIDLNNMLRSSVNIELYGASSVDDHGKFIYKNYISNLPNIAAPNFIEEFNNILKINQIHFVIPTHDTVSLFLKINESLLESQIISANLETTNLCRYKSLMYQKFSDYDFAPDLYDESLSAEDYPVFIKPDQGEGGKNTALINNKKELDNFLIKHPDMLICEYLPGVEISIDCFTDKNGNLRIVSPRTRSRIMAGISVRSELIEITSEIQKIADIINTELTFQGYWFFQLKKDKLGKYKLLEISCRFAGTFIASASRDINFPLITIYDKLGIDIDISTDKYNILLDRAFINRYILQISYDFVYIDLDDTLIINNKVNSQLMMFIYQCLNKGKKIFLITKHEKNVKQTLAHYCIDPSLFTEIYHLEAEQEKMDYFLENQKAIFIDNSYAERNKIRQNLNIPVFDLFQLECLLDWRG